MYVSVLSGFMNTLSFSTPGSEPSINSCVLTLGPIAKNMREEESTPGEKAGMERELS